jgi:hypothetical protein
LFFINVCAVFVEIDDLVFFFGLDGKSKQESQPAFLDIDFSTFNYMADSLSDIFQVSQ